MCVPQVHKKKYEVLHNFFEKYGILTNKAAFFTKAQLHNYYGFAKECEIYNDTKNSVETVGNRHSF